MDANISVEIDPNFEPQIRARSNTWPCRPVEDFIDGQQVSPASDDPGLVDHTKDVLGIKQKTSSRRNAWGNLSYADLITKAIQGSPEQRLTLSQVYDWMVQNVPYFKDKGDNTSSAGWKNSIRHNLSLHSRFMRIQNEGTGKSSWWVINPDAKPGKAPRRRAGSMETKSLEKKRGRIKKRIEAIRAAQENGTYNSEDFQDLNYKLSLSPEQFRNRTGSNASSCGRLSPIQAAVEPDLHDGQVPPMSPIPWMTEIDDFNSNSSENFSIVDSLVGGLNIKEGGNSMDETDLEMNTMKPGLLSGSSMIQFNSQNSYDDGFGVMPAPPSYTDHLQQQNSHQTSVLNLDTMAVQNGNYNSMPPNKLNMYQESILAQQQQQQQQQRQLIQNIPSPCSNSLGINTQQQHVGSPGRSPQLSPSNYTSPRGYNGPIRSPQPIKRSPNQQQQQQLLNQQLSQQQQQLEQQQQMNSGTRSLLQQCLEAPNDSILRAHLTQQQTNPTYQPQQTPPQYGQYNNTYTSAPLPNMSPSNSLNMRTGSMSGTGNMSGLNNINNNINMLPPSGMGSNSAPPVNTTQMTSQGPIRNISNPSLAEIDTDCMLDLDYDVEQLLRQELAMDANLDFNFDGNQSTQNATTSEQQNLVR